MIIFFFTIIKWTQGQGSVAMEKHQSSVLYFTMRYSFGRLPWHFVQPEKRNVQIDNVLNSHPGRSTLESGTFFEKKAGYIDNSCLCLYFFLHLPLSNSKWESLSVVGNLPCIFALVKIAGSDWSQISWTRWNDGFVLYEYIFKQCSSFCKSNISGMEKKSNKITCQQ